MLSENIEQRVYEDIVNMLTIHDIQLIVFTLEALYHLSELGEASSNHIAKVHSSIGEYVSIKHTACMLCIACIQKKKTKYIFSISDTLVQMVTIEAQAYGPNSLLGIKVVEHVPAQQQQQANDPPPFAQRAGAPKHLLTPNRTPGIPQRPLGAMTPPRPTTTPTIHRPGTVPTPPLSRPGVVPTPPYRQGATVPPHRTGLVTTSSIQRPGLSPCHSKFLYSAVSEFLWA